LERLDQCLFRKPIVASHLTITSTGIAGTVAKPFGASQAAGEGEASGIFAAMVGNRAPEASPTAPVTTPAVDTDVAGLFGIGLDGELGAETDGETADAEALAAAIELPQAIVEEPKPMVDFVEAIGALKASLDRGEPLDPELLKQVNAALADLAEALGLDLDSLPVPEDFAALLDGEDGLAGAMSQLLAPLAQSLDTAQPATDAAGAIEADAAADQLKTLSDKLGALLAAIEDGKVPADKLAALGMTPGQPMNDEIEAALAKFTAANTAAEAPSVPEEPVLATPALKLTDTALSGQPDRAELAPASETRAAAAPAEAPRRDDRPRDRRPDRDRTEPVTRERPTAQNNAAPAPPEASNAPAPSADAAAQQAQTARVDAAANPRIIQAGYQTSQQQLNLPQIAFELARQVQDGNTRFQIRLDPPELGRIDVRLEINETGQVHARLTVEKAETLDLMQRDQRGLERALQQAGLDSNKTNLEFSLKQNPFSGQGGAEGESKNGGGFGGGDDKPVAEEAENAPPTVNLYRGSLMASGINIVA
jgi:flagellar hook-length control protein FliK